MRRSCAPDGHYGHVLISRWALGDIKLHDISQPRHERRRLTLAGRVGRLLTPALPAHTVGRSFPAGLPLFMLDRIYCRPRAALLRAWTDRQAWWAWDHLPVIADLRFA